MAHLLGGAPLSVESDLGFGSGEANGEPAAALEAQLEPIPAIHRYHLPPLDPVPLLLHPTLEDLARAAGITYSALSKIEAGYSQDPRVKTLQKIARALDVTIDDLMDDGK